MEHPLSDMMTNTMSKIKDMIDVNTVVGSPITTPGGVTIIPVTKVSIDGLLLFRTVDLEIPASPAADDHHGQHQQERSATVLGLFRLGFRLRLHHGRRLGSLALTLAHIHGIGNSVIEPSSL